MLRHIFSACRPEFRKETCVMRLLGKKSLVAATASVAVIIIAPHVRSASVLPPPTFTQTNLVSDVPNMARRTDTNLVNPWGMALGLNSGLWIAINGSGRSASVDGTGQPVAPGTVTIPTPDGSGKSAPTGVATNATTGFIISAGGKSAPSTELFATEDGTIAGWSMNVDPANAVIAVNNSSMGAVYKGLAIGFNRHGTFLFATNFHAGTIDMFDANFQPVHHDRFRDPYMPAGYAPFGIASINARLYVSYALQDAQKKDDVAGAGHGFIDIFDTEGNLLKRSPARASSTRLGGWLGRRLKVSAGSTTRCLWATLAMAQLTCSTSILEIFWAAPTTRTISQSRFRACGR